jgi:flagellar hook assembly protein FlgD
MTYTGAPQRTIPLDSVKGDAGPYQWIYPPLEQTIDFEVLSVDTCKVLIELRNSGTKLVRILKDSLYTAGKQSLNWSAVDTNKVKLPYGYYYYRFDICGKVFNRKFDFRPQKF